MMYDCMTCKLSLREVQGAQSGSLGTEQHVSASGFVSDIPREDLKHKLGEALIKRYEPIFRRGHELNGIDSGHLRVMAPQTLM